MTVEYHDLAKYAKDIAAFSVLIVSILAFIIGLIVFFHIYVIKHMIINLIIKKLKALIA
ncbi:Diacylglycerol kinase [Staphylococcus aureus]|nr:Diacylglycerol kinase [Staphylococcus aureus]